VNKLSESSVSVSSPLFLSFSHLSHTLKATFTLLLLVTPQLLVLLLLLLLLLCSWTA
jgi:hypothetical protein